MVFVGFHCLRHLPLARFRPSLSSLYSHCNKDSRPLLEVPDQEPSRKRREMEVDGTEAHIDLQSVIVYLRGRDDLPRPVVHFGFGSGHPPMNLDRGQGCGRRAEGASVATSAVSTDGGYLGPPWTGFPSSYFSAPPTNTGRVGGEGTKEVHECVRDLPVPVTVSLSIPSPM